MGAVTLWGMAGLRGTADLGRLGVSKPFNDELPDGLCLRFNGSPPSSRGLAVWLQSGMPEGRAFPYSRSWLVKFLFLNIPASRLSTVDHHSACTRDNL